MAVNIGEAVCCPLPSYSPWRLISAFQHQLLLPCAFYKGDFSHTQKFENTTSKVCVLPRTRGSWPCPCRRGGSCWSGTRCSRGRRSRRGRAGGSCRCSPGSGRWGYDSQSTECDAPRLLTTCWWSSRWRWTCPCCPCSVSAPRPRPRPAPRPAPARPGPQAQAEPGCKGEI